MLPPFGGKGEVFAQARRALLEQRGRALAEHDLTPGDHMAFFAQAAFSFSTTETMSESHAGVAEGGSSPMRRDSSREPPAGIFTSGISPKRTGTPSRSSFHWIA